MSSPETPECPAPSLPDLLHAEGHARLGIIERELQDLGLGRSGGTLRRVQETMAALDGLRHLEHAGERRKRCGTSGWRHVGLDCDHLR